LRRRIRSLAGDMPDEEELRRLCVVAAELVETAILTDRALPDRERRWLSGPRCALPDPEPDQRLAYDSEGARDDAARAARHRPTRDDITRYPVVMGWLTWLRRQNDGGRDLQILMMRAAGAPMWRIAQQFGRSDDTIRRWETGAIATIVNRYWREILAMDTEGRRQRERQREIGWRKVLEAERRHRRRSAGR
jgi:hypothetical protein